MKKLTTEEFIEKARQIHGDKYDYSKVSYMNSRTKVCIICLVHGEFWQTPSDHLLGKGCKKCGVINRGLKHRSSTENFIEKARVIHNDKYDYSKVEYENNKAEVCIICPIHGEFWQRPNDHLSGYGCPICKTSRLELLLLNVLNENNIDFIYQCRKKNLPWLDSLTIDFYLPKHKIGIECQGSQHFIENHFYEPLKIVQERDNRKRNLCESNGVKLLYYSDLEIIYPYEVITDKNNLLKEIEKYEK